MDDPAEQARVIVGAIGAEELVLLVKHVGAVALLVLHGEMVVPEEGHLLLERTGGFSHAFQPPAAHLALQSALGVAIFDSHVLAFIIRAIVTATHGSVPSAGGRTRCWTPAGDRFQRSGRRRRADPSRRFPALGRASRRNRRELPGGVLWRGPTGCSVSSLIRQGSSCALRQICPGPVRLPWLFRQRCSGGLGLGNRFGEGRFRGRGLGGGRVGGGALGIASFLR